MAQATSSTNFLIPASARLAQSSGFRLIGRQADIDALHDTLMRKNEGAGDNVRNNVILYGQSGVGLSSLILSMEAAKADPEDLTTPIEIVDKNFFYLDVNELFSQTSKDAITKGFLDALTTLRSTPNAVLVIEDANSFIKGIGNNQAPSILSELMKAIGPNNEFQAIFAGSYEDVGLLNSSHTDIAKNFVLQLVKEPPKNELREILEYTAKKIGDKYGLTISEDAISSLLKLIEKYPGITSRVGFAQPRCAIELLEGAAVSYCRTAQARPEGLDELEAKLADIAAAEEGKATGTAVDDLSKDELASLREKTAAEIAAKTSEWKINQKKIRVLRKELDGYPAKLQLIQNSINREMEKEEAKKQAYETLAAAGDNKESIEQTKKDFFAVHGEELVWPRPQEETRKSPRGAFNLGQKMSQSGFGGNLRITKEKELLEAGRKEFENKRAAFDALTRKGDGNGLVMTDTQVLTEFSRLSRIEVSKLKQDEGQKLLNLEEILGKRIFGQPEPLNGLAKAVRTAKAGMKNKTKAIGNFLFLGPTGTGKTETALALAEALFGDDAALRKYPMEDYSEENAVTQLVGAPQGYQGHEQGGQLINNMLEMPECVNLFDEIEKAHANVFNPFLAVTDTKNAYLVDRRTGDKVSFANAVNIFTSNVGQTFFLNQTLTPKQARDLALQELRQNPKFKPEFLGRLQIFCYDRLSPDAVENIAKKSLREMGELAVEQGLTINIPVDQNIKEMCDDVYDPLTGGRGVVNYIDSEISSKISDIILENQGQSGSVAVTYIPGKVTDQEKADIRKTVEAEGTDQYMDDIRPLILNEFKSEKIENDDDRAAVKEKMKKRQDELIQQRAEAKIAAEIKALKKERGLIEATFAADKAAAAPKAAANQNTASRMAKLAM